MTACYVAAVVQLGWNALAQLGVIRFGPYPYAFLLSLPSLLELPAAALLRGLGAIRAHAIDVSQRPDWPQIKADIDAVCTENVLVDALGHRTDLGVPAVDWPLSPDHPAW